MITDIKYIGLISLRLRNFKKKNNRTWNCSCPLCGDSKKDTRKARGYFLPMKDKIMYKCHNCGIALPFGAFLKRIDPDLHKEYVRERFGGKFRSRRPDMAKSPKSDTTAKMKKIRDNSCVLDELTSFDEMPEQHHAYLIARGLPMDHLRRYFYYTDTFKAFSNGIAPGSFSQESLAHDEPRIVIVFFDENDKVIGVQGRELTTSYAKYITIKIDKNEKKIFGLDRIDPRKPVYVVEGPIDSLFIENCIATCDADLVSKTRGMFKTLIYIFDNEPRSHIACKKIHNAIDDKERIVIFPSIIHEKDINDMVLSGKNITQIVTDNTYRGLRASAEFTRWRRT